MLIMTSGLHFSFFLLTASHFSFHSLLSLFFLSFCFFNSFLVDSSRVNFTLFSLFFLFDLVTVLYDKFTHLFIYSYQVLFIILITRPIHIQIQQRTIIIYKTPSFMFINISSVCPLNNVAIAGLLLRPYISRFPTKSKQLCLMLSVLTYHLDFSHSVNFPIDLT